MKKVELLALRGIWKNLKWLLFTVQTQYTLQAQNSVFVPLQAILPMKICKKG